MQEFILYSGGHEVNNISRVVQIDMSKMLAGREELSKQVSYRNVEAEM